MSDTRAALLAAVKADPDADTPRLLFADWCDDNGEPERAEFVRANVTLSRAPRSGCCDRVGNTLAADPPGVVPCACPWAELTRRHGDLLPAGGFPGCLPFEAVHCWADHGPDPVPPGRRVNWVRGFVDRVACPAADWLAHADAILAEHPVRAVRLTTVPEIHRLDVWKTLYALSSTGPWYDARELTQVAIRHGGTYPGLETPGTVGCLLIAQWPGITFTLPPPARTHQYSHWERAVAGTVLTTSPL